MFRFGFSQVPYYAFIYIEKVVFMEPISSPLFMTVQRKKRSKGIFHSAFHSETKYEHTDSHNIVHFDNEFIVPITLFIDKKDQKKSKKTIEINLCSNKQNKKDEIIDATWKFDLANLEDEKFTGLRTSPANTKQYGPAVLFIRICVKEQSEFPSKPKQFYSFVTAKNKTPEIENSIENNEVTDIDFKIKC